MSSIVSTTTNRQTHTHQTRPSFFSLVGSEFFKVTRMWSTWITLVLLMGTICLPYLVFLSVSDFKEKLNADPLSFLMDNMQTGFSVLRVFTGFFLIILTANVFGREYQLGTVRILLARGIGRLQLMFAKLFSVLVIGLMVFLLGILLNTILTILLLVIKAGDLSALSAINNDFWHYTGIYLLTVLVSMGATILMTVAMTAIGRSLTVGLSAGMAWFPADNMITLILFLVFRLTQNDFWNNISVYLLGPNLNAMPAAILPEKLAQSSMTQIMGQPPNAPVDGTHTLLVALGYSIVFLAISIYLTWKRDVKE